MKINERELEHIPLHEIDLGDRAREEYGDIAELAADIKEIGVISPIAVLLKEAVKDQLGGLGETDPERPYLLMAGGRRVTASIEAELIMIPAQIYTEPLTELELRIIELHENTKRKDFSFVEDIRAKKAIHLLMVEAYGEKVSTAPDATGISLRDTAEMLKVSAATMSQDFRLADAMEKHPELADHATKKEAVKAYDDIVRKKAMKILLDRQKLKQSGDSEDTHRKKLADSYMLGNFFHSSKHIQDGTVNIVEIDPPYSIELDKMKKEGDTDDYNEIRPEHYEAFMREVLNESFRVMTQHSWLICWFGPDPWFEPMYNWIIEAGMPEETKIEDWTKSKKGFQLRRLPGLWVKPTGQTMQPSRYLANASEHFFYARKGDPSLAKPGTTNVFNYSPVPAQRKVHPTERPIEMIQDLLKTFGRPGNTVLVPFAGSGNTLLAAANSDMVGFGWDLSEVYKNAFDIRVTTEPFRQWRSY